jgi:hypothetical protein
MGGWYDARGGGPLRGSIGAMDAIGASEALLLYSRDGCHLCEDAHLILDALLERRASAGLAAPPVALVDIDQDRPAHDRFHDVIPVIAWGERRLELAISASAIGRFLSEVLDVADPGDAR